MFNQAQDYVAVLHFASAKKKARPWLLLVTLGWLILPFALRSVVANPADVIWAHYYTQGLAPPHSFTAQQSAVGFTEALIGLSVLVLVQLVCTVMFYRRTALDMGSVATPPLWPCAALLPGILGNAAWYGWTGDFDLVGCLIGLSPTALTVGAELIVNRLGKNFVLGLLKGQLV